MKKLIALFFILSCVSVARAERVGWGNVYRTSVTNSADLNVVITTYPSVVRGVNIGSSTANGYISFYDATTFTNAVSTKMFQRTDISNIGGYVETFDMKFSSGLMYATNMPLNRITIFWDWMVLPNTNTQPTLDQLKN